MAEQAPTIQSKRLLLVSLVLAGIVVAIYNVHVGQVREGAKGKKVELLKFRRNMDEGEVITRKDVRVEEVDRKHRAALGNVVPNRDLDYAIGRRLNKPGKKEEFVKYGHVTAGLGEGPSGDIPKGMVAVALEIDPRNALGDILRVNDRVNIRAKLWPPKAKQLSTYRVIEGVRVIAVGGRGEVGQTMRRGPSVGASRMLRSYRSITVLVPKATSLGLENVLSHRAGSVTLELCSSVEVIDERSLKISDKVKGLAEFASVGKVEG